MDVASRSRSRVKERLTRLEEEFGKPEVTQTTFEVGSDRYERAIERSRGGQLNLQVVVRDDTGSVLLCADDDEWLVPQGQTRPNERLAEAVRRIVEETAGVDCAVTDVSRANIHGIRNSDDESADTVYRLSVVFAAETVGAAQPNSESVRWGADTEAGGERV